MSIRVTFTFECGGCDASAEVDGGRLGSYFHSFSGSDHGLGVWVNDKAAEPLLGPLVNLPQAATRPGKPGLVPDSHHGPSGHRASEAGELDLTGIDWLICGGESGPNHRPMNSEWVRDLRDACKGTMPIPLMGGPEDNDLVPDDDGSGTAFFVKQGSGARPGQQGDLPDDLWAFKEFPQGVTG